VDQSYYKPIYKTAEARALYLTGIKGYGSVSAMAKDLGVHRQWISYVFKHGLSLKFAGYLGRKFGFPVPVLDYESYVQVFGGEKSCLPYSELFKIQEFFSATDVKYILAAPHIKDGIKHARILDKAI